MNTYKTKNMIRVIVLVFIFTVVTGIWVVKKNQAVSSSVEDHPDFALNVTEKLDLDQLKSYAIPIILDFGADSCVPCKEMKPVLEELNEAFRGRAIILFLDVWKYAGLAEGYPIRAIPTQILIDGEGKPYVPGEENDLRFRSVTSEDETHLFTTHEGGLTKDDLLRILADMGVN